MPDEKPAAAHRPRRTLRVGNRLEYLRPRRNAGSAECPGGQSLPSVKLPPSRRPSPVTYVHLASRPRQGDRAVSARATP